MLSCHSATASNWHVDCVANYHPPLSSPTHYNTQEFKTVMSALKSNNERWGIMNVTLVFRQPSGPEEAELCVEKPLR